VRLRAADRAQRRLHVYTVRLEDHEERIVLPLHIQVVAGSALPNR
jgi:hypothetical protein